MPTPPADYYALLHLRPTADAEIVRAVYRVLARRLESETGRSPQARAALVELNTAYWVLSDPVRRAAYDQELAEPVPEPAASESEGQPAVVPVAMAPDDRPSIAPDQVSFGRYAGWSLREILRHDPEYLVWLQRHSSGMRYRRQIEKLLRDAGIRS